MAPQWGGQQAGASERCFSARGAVFLGDVAPSAAAEPAEGETPPADDSATAAGEGGTLKRQGLGRLVVYADDLSARPESVAASVQGGDAAAAAAEGVAPAGKLLWATFEGLFYDDKMRDGVYRFADGSVYEGQLDDEGRPHGMGKYMWPDLSSYVGRWEAGEMHGQGRFVSHFDGQFLEGAFYRDCFQLNSGRWVDVRDLVERAEALSLTCSADNVQAAQDRSNGTHTIEDIVGGGGKSPAPVLELVRCADDDAMRAEITRCHEDNVVPLVICDGEAERVSRTACEAVDESSTAAFVSYLKDVLGVEAIHLQAAAALLRRGQQPPFRDTYDAARATNAHFAVVADEFDGARCPWSLEHFFDSWTLPRGMLNPRVFHGRGGTEGVVVAPDARAGGEAASSSSATAVGDSDGETQGAPTGPLVSARVDRLLLVSGTFVEPHGSDAVITEDIRQSLGDCFPLQACRLVMYSATL